MRLMNNGFAADLARYGPGRLAAPVVTATLPCRQPSCLDAVPPGLVGSVAIMLSFHRRQDSKDDKLRWTLAPSLDLGSLGNLMSQMLRRADDNKGLAVATECSPDQVAIEPGDEL